MGLMTWKADYSVGIAEIDQQHKKLIDMINTLNDAMSKGKAKDVLSALLTDLVSYTKTHFAREEKLMGEHGYPDFADHKDKHAKMAAKVLALQEEVQRGKAMISMEVMKFLEQWLDKHILGTDKKYGPYLNSKGVN
ncbi:MAG: bacteriohemerythrin [Thermodesulfobacteriota bacterium]